MPLAWPVVPEVKATSATSSAAVSQLSKVAGFFAIIASSPSPASLLKNSTSVQHLTRSLAILISSASLASESANFTRALSRM